MKYLTLTFTLIGIITVLYGAIGLVVDIKTFDRTKGGYDYPYENWSGTPVDWDLMDITKTGLVKRGYVLDVHINGTTGMISFGALGLKWDWQRFSKRALKVHKPKEALIRKGFTPKF
ncbi:MAG: hypothetical protein ABJM06_05665 [Gilvibacter sp.]